MAEIVWTEEAERWLRDIHDYIAADNPVAAAKVVAGIFEKSQALRHFPEIGHKYRDEPEGKKTNFALWTLSYRVPAASVAGNRRVGRVSWCVGALKVLAMMRWHNRALELGDDSRP